MEAAWAYQHKPWVGGYLAKRQQGLDQEITDIAWKAQWRLCTRYKKLAGRGKNKTQIVAAIGQGTARLHLGNCSKKPRTEHALRDSLRPQDGHCLQTFSAAAPAPSRLPSGTLRVALTGPAGKPARREPSEEAMAILSSRRSRVFELLVLRICAGGRSRAHGKGEPSDLLCGDGLCSQPAVLVRGSSRRITIVRFRPADIRVINRYSSFAFASAPVSCIDLHHLRLLWPLVTEQPQIGTYLSASRKKVLTGRSISKEELQCQLTNARVLCTRDTSEAARTGGNVRIVEVDPVENVEESPRNCSLLASLLNRNSLKIPISQFIRFGPLRAPLPTFPKVPAAGTANALGTR